MYISPNTRPALSSQVLRFGFAGRAREACRGDSALRGRGGGEFGGVRGMGFHSSTSQLNLSRFGQ
jgi:hypothetical protein